MSTVDVASLLEPVSAEQPCGEELAGERLLLDAEAQPKPDPENSERSLPPDWRRIQQQAEALLSRSKDLKVAVVLTQALTETQQLAGLADGLSLLRELLEQYWEGLYPLPDEDGELFERANALAPLADLYVDGQDASDSVGKIAFSFRRLPLVRVQRLGEFTLRDYRLAHRQWRFFVRSDATHPSAAEIDGAFQECDLAQLQVTHQSLEQAETDLGAMERFLQQQVSDEPPTFQQLLRELGDARKLLAKALQKRGGMAVAEFPSENAASAPTPVQDEPVANRTRAVPVAPTGTVVAGVAAPGEIRGRDDVVETLDRLCEYYQRNERSSPVPLLLKRARRLVNMDFMDILEDLAPAGLDQARMIQGATGTSGEEAGDAAGETTDPSSSW